MPVEGGLVSACGLPIFTGTSPSVDTLVRLSGLRYSNCFGDAGRDGTFNSSQPCCAALNFNQSPHTRGSVTPVTPEE
jgi:hypothetical protein